MSAFEGWPKIPRANNLNVVITEKIDGTNAQIYIPGDAHGVPTVGFFVGSRNRWITPESDNFGFARWAYENAEVLRRLGPGRHYGEWWGAGIQRAYGLSVKRWSLFDARRWTPERLEERGLTGLVDAVPILEVVTINYLQDAMDRAGYKLLTEGSMAAPGFMLPEGYVVQIGEARFKVTDGKNGNKIRTELEIPPPEAPCASNPTPPVVDPLPSETPSLPGA